MAPCSWPLYGKPEEEAVLALVRRPDYAPLADLEKAWKNLYKVPYAQPYCNGTSALASMFFALNLPPGSEIMVPSYTFFATIVPMRLFGLVPVFVDVNPRTLNFDLDDAKRRLTKNSKAVLPVHWIGLPADMDHICDWAKEKGLIVLEDSCHAHARHAQGPVDGHLGRNGRLQLPSQQASARHRGRDGQLPEAGASRSRRHVRTLRSAVQLRSGERVSAVPGLRSGAETADASHGGRIGAFADERLGTAKYGRRRPGAAAQ